MELTINNKIIDKINKSPYLTRKNLELILGSNRRTLDYRISSLIKKNILTRLKTGFYISNEYLEKETDNERYFEYLGCILKEPSYVSLRYALSKYNLIPESIFDLTLVTTKKTNRFSTAFKSFAYKNITEKFYFGYNSLSYKNKIINFAYPYKAVFDLFYYTKLNSKEELQDYVESSRINWDNLDKTNKSRLRKLLKTSNLKRMSQLLEVLQEQEIL